MGLTRDGKIAQLKNELDASNIKLKHLRGEFDYWKYRVKLYLMWTLRLSGLFVAFVSMTLDFWLYLLHSTRLFSFTYDPDIGFIQLLACAFGLLLLGLSFRYEEKK